VADSRNKDLSKRGGLLLKDLTERSELGISRNISVVIIVVIVLVIAVSGVALASTSKLSSSQSSSTTTTLTSLSSSTSTLSSSIPGASVTSTSFPSYSSSSPMASVSSSMTIMTSSFTTSSQAFTCASTSASTSAGNVMVDVMNSAYAPSTIRIVEGVNNTVTWINKDGIGHTVTETPSLSFNGFLSPNGGTFTCTFLVAGTYNYFCTIHPFMQGKVIVDT